MWSISFPHHHFHKTNRNDNNMSEWQEPPFFFIHCYLFCLTLCLWYGVSEPENKFPCFTEVWTIKSSIVLHCKMTVTDTKWRGKRKRTSANLCTAASTLQHNKGVDCCTHLYFTSFSKHFYHHWFTYLFLYLSNHFY